MITFWQEIHAASSVFSLDPRLVAAQVTIESNVNPWAWNPEPRYRYFWDYKAGKPFRAVTDTEVLSKFPPSDFHSHPESDPDNEWWAQQASWGLMQIMGAVARELGFVGPYLTELVQPTKNLTLGCTKLRHLLDWAHGNVDQALAAYNGGEKNNTHAPFQNQSYADKVKHAMSLVEV